MSILGSITRMTRVLTVLFGLSSLGSAAILAEPGPRGYGRHEPGGMHQLLETLETLSLTAEQQAVIDKIFATHRDAAQSRGGDFMAAQKALADQIHAEPLDEAAIRQAAATIAGFEADRAVAEATILSQVRAQLTPAQRTQLQQELTTNTAMMPPGGPMMPRNRYK